MLGVKSRAELKLYINRFVAVSDHYFKTCTEKKGSKSYDEEVSERRHSTISIDFPPTSFPSSEQYYMYYYYVR